MNLTPMQVVEALQPEKTGERKRLRLRTLQGKLPDPMKRTSTSLRTWRFDCESFGKDGGFFQLNDVTTREHADFVSRFCDAHHYTFSKAGKAIIFAPVGG